MTLLTMAFIIQFFDSTLKDLFNGATNTNVLEKQKNVILNPSEHLMNKDNLSLALKINNLEKTKDLSKYFRILFGMETLTL